MNADENTGDGLKGFGAVPHYENTKGGELAIELFSDVWRVSDSRGQGRIH